MAVEQCLWFIGNIISESKPLRDHVFLHTCLVDSLLRLIKHPNLSHSLLKTVCWVATNIARHKALSAQHTMACLQIARVGIFVSMEDVVSDSLWTLSYLTDTDDDIVLDKVA